MNPKVNQQPEGKKKRRKNRRGGNNDRENAINEKKNHKVDEGKEPKRKVKFPCKICGGDHLMHFFPRIYKASNFIA